MVGKEGATRRVIVLSLITAACLIGDSMLYIVLPVHFAEAGLGSLWEVGIILSANRLVRLAAAQSGGRVALPPHQRPDRHCHCHRAGGVHHARLCVCARLRDVACAALRLGCGMDSLAAGRFLLHPERFF